MRLFLALQLPLEVKRRLFDAAAQLLEVRWGLTDPVYQRVFRLKYVPEDNLHITLKFLGEVAEAQVPKLCDALTNVEGLGPLSLRTEGLEFFPNRGPIHVVAAKVVGDTDRVCDLHRQLENTCAVLGFEREKRAYRPHVTLLRANSGIPAHLREGYYYTSSRRDCTVHTVPPFGPSGEFLVPEFVLLESRLGGRQGPEYLPVARFSLNKPG